jgi:hypothetical protein
MKSEVLAAVKMTRLIFSPEYGESIYMFVQNFGISILTSPEGLTAQIPTLTFIV